MPNDTYFVLSDLSDFISLSESVNNMEFYNDNSLKPLQVSKVLKYMDSNQRILVFLLILTKCCA